LLSPLAAIDGGVYTLGSDERLYEDEGPAHPVEIAPFAIGRFPVVTNAEWALFMQAGGYDNECWWVTEEDQAWRRGESTAQGSKRQWREDRKTLQNKFDQIRIWHREGRITSKQADDWEQIARMSDDEFEAQLEEWYPPGRQTAPRLWSDDAYNNPDQPVVGVSWYEARAYCAWLSAQANRTFRLPTEAEWETAARGSEGRRFAYGNDFDAARCNTFETHVRRTTPLGVFPGGETPDTGLVDMTGIVWEWTSSLNQPYPYDLKDGRENPITGDARRVVRGGSWNNNQDNARAAYRNHNNPDNRNNNVGFRLVCSAHMFTPFNGNGAG
jgi:formylglycine-generating enzyme required for sulfatase activity